MREIGLDQARMKAEVTRVFNAGESTAVEQALMARRFAEGPASDHADPEFDNDPAWAAPVDITPTGGAVKPALAVALLEVHAAANYVGEAGYDPSYGARPLRRLLQRRVENELSKRLLRGEYATGDHVVVDYDPALEGENKLTFTKVAQAPIPVDLPVHREQE